MYLQFVVFFLLLLTGFFCRRYKLFGDAAINNINRFILLVGYPALILVRTTGLDMTLRIFYNFLLMFVLSIALFLLFAGYAYLYAKKRHFPPEDSPATELAMFFPNNGFMGFPIAFTFFGDLGLLYMVANVIALNTFSFTYGVSTLTRGRGHDKETFPQKLKNFVLIIINPKVSAALVGIALCMMHFHFPDFLEQFLELIGGCATPLAMISIGTIIATGMSKAALKNRVVAEASIHKIVVIPLLAFALIFFLPIDSMVKAVLILAFVLPTAANVVILSEQYGANKELAGTILVVTTLVSMGTVPLGIWTLRLLGLH